MAVKTSALVIADSIADLDSVIASAPVVLCLETERLYFRKSGAWNPENGNNIAAHQHSESEVTSLLSDLATKCDGDDPRLSDIRIPVLHAASHQNGGLDEIATTVAGSGAVPKAGLNGKLDVGWLPIGSGNGLDADMVDGQHASAFEPVGSVATHAAASDPHSVYQKETEKNSAGGYAGLDAGGKLNGAQQVYGTAVGTACQGNDARLSDARAPLAHTHSKADVMDLEAVSVTGAANALVKGNASGKIDTSWLPPGQSGVSQMIVPLVSDAAGITWTNMPAAVTFFGGSHRFATKLDLTAYSQVRLIVNKQATAGVAGSIVRLRYRATFDAIVTNWLQIGEVSVQVAADVQNTVLDSGWSNLAAEAKGDVFIVLDGLGGNGTTDPAFGSIIAQFR